MVGFALCSTNPTTGCAWATLTCPLTAARIITGEELVVPGSFCHHDDPTCSPAGGTAVGTMSITGSRLFRLCTGSSTPNFTAEWVAPDGSYTPPTMVVFTWGTYGGQTYHIDMNRPSGTYTFVVNLSFTDGTTEAMSVTDTAR